MKALTSDSVLIFMNLPVGFPTPEIPTEKGHIRFIVFKCLFRLMESSLEKPKQGQLQAQKKDKKTETPTKIFIHESHKKFIGA